MQNAHRIHSEPAREMAPGNKDNVEALVSSGDSGDPAVGQSLVRECQCQRHGMFFSRNQKSRYHDMDCHMFQEDWDDWEK